jgi:hypothetical protein
VSAILFAERYSFRKTLGILMLQEWLKLLKYIYDNIFGKQLNSDWAFLGVALQNPHKITLKNISLI